MFGFIKKVFFKGLTILSSIDWLRAVPLNAIPLSAAPLNATLFKCASMTNQECKVRSQIVNVNSDGLYFILLVLKQVSVVVVLTISMMHM